jgi:hypothetical protein
VVLIDHTAADTPNLGVMCKDMDVSITPTKKCAQDPADDADNDRAPERAAKSVNVKANHDAWHYEQH